MCPLDVNVASQPTNSQATRSPVCMERVCLFMFAISVNVVDAERTERMLDGLLRSYVLLYFVLVITRPDRNCMRLVWTLNIL